MNVRMLVISIGLVALPALASAQTGEVEVEAEVASPDQGGVVFVESSEVEIVEEGQTPPPPPEAQAQVTLTVPQPPQVQLQVSDQRALLRQRLAEHPLGGPIAMTAVGIPIAAIFGLAAYYAYHVEDAVECFSDFECEDEEPNRVATAVLGTIAGVGLVLGVVGLVKLIIRVGHRAQIRREYHQGTLSFDGAVLRF
tara:strand:+ start:694 stop:1281 length:588 start_codon:yes stop_codon:yes gene_type:complete